MTNLQSTKINALVGELSQRILDGHYAAGQRLPAEPTFAEELRVSRQTIRTVLAHLQQCNLVTTVPRSGSYVNDPRARTHIGPTIPPGALPSADLLNQLRETQTGMRLMDAPSVVQVDDTLASMLSMAVGTRLLRRSCLYSVNGRPARCTESYYPAAIFDDLPGLDSDPWQWLLAHTDEVSPSAFERFICRMPSPQEVALLNLSRSQGVVDIARWTWISPGSLFAYTHVVANAALHEYTYVYTKANWKDLVGKVLAET